MPGPSDDKNPTLTKRTGKKAIVVISEKPFQSSRGGATWSVTGPGGKQHTYSYSFGGWDEQKANNLEEYFTEVMQESGAVVLIDRETIKDLREEERFANEGFYKDKTSHKGQVLRPDLKLVVKITHMQDDASGSETSGEAGGMGVIGTTWSFISGGGSRSTKKAECEIKIKIVDRRSGAVIATASGKAFSVGSTKSVSASGWSGTLGRSIFGGGSDSSYKKTNMEAALQRATVRAINSLIQKIPAKYFRHDPNA
jgi:curli biogenesis system outer membrane secretion channel CsgG